MSSTGGSAPHAVAPAFGPEPLTPVSFLDRSALVYGDRAGFVEGDVTRTYAEVADRCGRLAGALRAEGAGRGAVVSVLAPNTAMALEAHYGVPMSGAALNALNTRLSVDELAYIVGHAGSNLLLADHELADTARAVIARLDRPVRVLVSGGDADEYEGWLGDADVTSPDIPDEWQLLSINYTSGTTGRPKGVMYAHRGAFLQALAMATQAGMSSATRFLWTLPMFHCNGWCFPWAVTAVGGVHVGLRRVEPAAIWRAIHDEGVTHFNAAPTVLTSLIEHPDARPAAAPIRVATGGAPPSPTLIERLAALNIEVTHLYGLTETYGPAVICDWRPEWDQLAPADRARRKALQGVANLVSRNVRVVDDLGNDLPADGESQGEVVLRGNVVMLGYYRDPEATAAATSPGPGGPWFRTGDIGVLHPDGYLELRDRSKDVIISGGENIASIEVEQALAAHDAVAECAVVAAPDDHWGEVPVAFVVLRNGFDVSEQDLIDHVKSRLARFKAPKRIVFGELPKTSTGKIQKFVLRDQLRGERSADVSTG
ncbi:MAG: AMP-binding protein [Ilumatobacteraceae bacterium]